MERRTVLVRSYNCIVEANALSDAAVVCGRAFCVCRLANGELAQTPEQNLEVACEHFYKQYNLRRPFDPEAAKIIEQHSEMGSLDHEISFNEFKKATMKLKNGKAPGITGAPPDAFELLNEENLRFVHGFVVDFWNNNADYWQWHIGLGIMVPKKGDLSDPNKWRVINLMDMFSKILSIVLNDRLYTLLEKHGNKTQYRATPGVGCADGSFVLKTLLHQRKQHNLESFVIFVDLVKIYDTVNHDLLIDVLERYGTPPKMRSAIKRMYTDLKVKISVEGKTAEISQTVRVRQGDNLLPVLFLFFMSAFAESLEKEWRQSNIKTAQFMRASQDYIMNGKGSLTGQAKTRDSIFPYGKGSIFNILQILYIDDGAFIFSNRDNMIKRAEIINRHFKKFGMEMHAGRDGKESKKEYLWIPIQPFLKTAVDELGFEDKNCTDISRISTAKENQNGI